MLYMYRMQFIHFCFPFFFLLRSGLPKKGTASYLTFDLLVWCQEVPPFLVYCPLECSIASAVVPLFK